VYLSYPAFLLDLFLMDHHLLHALLNAPPAPMINQEAIDSGLLHLLHGLAGKHMRAVADPKSECPWIFISENLRQKLFTPGL
jgi:hypothetical protein